MSMLKAVEGISRNGQLDRPERGSDASQAADLRHRLALFAEDWDRPEMDAYDDLPPR